MLTSVVVVVVVVVELEPAETGEEEHSR